MKFVVYSHPDSFEMEEYYINKLFSLGMDSFHLRKPGWSTADLSLFLTFIDPAFHSNIVIHDHVELLEDYDLAGIHLTRSFLKNYAADDLRGRGLGRCKVISRSIHSLQAAKEEVNGFFNRFIVSPIFNPISKQGEIETWSKEDLIQLSGCLLSGELVALGGIYDETIKLISPKMFDGFACLGYLWNQTDRIIDKFSRMQSWAREVELSKA